MREMEETKIPVESAKEKGLAQIVFSSLATAITVPLRKTKNKRNKLTCFHVEMCC